MKLSCVILTKNEAELIKDCIRSLRPLSPNEVLVVDDESTDKTVAIAKSLGAKVIVHRKLDFAEARNFAVKKTRGEWILYIDADERLTPELCAAITQELESGGSFMAAFSFPRVNYYLGKRWPHTESVVRLFRRGALLSWRGSLHESPYITGAIKQLNAPLVHFTHRNLSEMVENTLVWSAIEARLRYGVKHPPVSWWRLPRVMLPTFIDYYFIQGGWRVGTVGLIESMYQAFSIFITYARLWELQQHKNRN